MIDQEYINSLSVDQLRRELTLSLEQIHGFSKALKDLPEVPSHIVLYMLSSPAMSMWDDIYDRGKIMQRQYGLDAIPPKSEYECAAGLWELIRNALIENATEE